MSIAPGTIDPGAPHFPPGERPPPPDSGLCDPDYMPYFAQYHATCQCWPEYYPPGTDCWTVYTGPPPPPSWYLLEALICNPGDPQEEWVAQPNAICAERLPGMSLWPNWFNTTYSYQPMPVPMPETWAFFRHQASASCNTS